MQELWLSLALWAVQWISPQDMEWLSALCWAETRGMAEMRDEACVSVVDTVLTRVSINFLSDGTIEGTITYGCGPGVLACQFPAYSVNGCAQAQRNAHSCPYDDPDGMADFRRIIEQYLMGILAPPCSGYVYYGSRNLDPDECVIQGGGQWIRWHRPVSISGNAR